MVGVGVVLAVVFFVVIFSIAMRPKTDTGSSTTASSQSNPENSSAAPITINTSAKISSADLAKNNGKSGSACWVAVNGKVYNVSSSPKWKNGQHTPSDGRAFCGADMSDVIGQSPHGATVLGGLPVVGTL